LLRPPAALSEEQFQAKCIKCGLCVEACPYKALVLAAPGDWRPKDRRDRHVFDAVRVSESAIRALDDRGVVEDRQALADLQHSGHAGALLAPRTVLTVEHVGFRKEVTAEAVERLIAGAVRLVPALRSARFVTAWSGLRPGTPDGLPVLGGCGVPGLFFAAGHFRNGILLAPVTALAVADLLTEGAPRDLSAFSIERF
jgi:ferredoxin